MIRKTYPQEYYKKLENIAALIKEYRLANGYSQIELAENMNLNRNTLSRVERGFDYHILNLIEIAETLEINLSELFYEGR
jgi:transcriptional regulator with XRE-family HTH domain